MTPLVPTVSQVAASCFGLLVVFVVLYLLTYALIDLIEDQCPYDHHLVLRVFLIALSVCGLLVTLYAAALIILPYLHLAGVF